MNEQNINACCGQILGHTRWCTEPIGNHRERAIRELGLLDGSESIVDSSYNREWMQTFTGRKFFPLDPDPEEIVIEDIAHHLAQICRYGGACKEFYSVAQHSVRASQCYGLSMRGLKLAALLHDASETYLGDVKGPIKNHVIFYPYKLAERHLQNVINVRFGLPPDADLKVKSADNAIYLREVNSVQLMAPRHPDWNVPPIEELQTGFVAWSWQLAEVQFLSEFTKLFYAGEFYETDFMQSGQDPA